MKQLYIDLIIGYKITALSLPDCTILDLIDVEMGHPPEHPPWTIPLGQNSLGVDTYAMLMHT